MIKLYDIVEVIKTGRHGAVVEIDDDNGTKPPVYLVEIIDEEKPEDADIEDVVFWCDYNEIKKLDEKALKYLMKIHAN